VDLHTLLPPAPLLLAFLAAALVLAITPGPGVAYIVTRTLGQGRRAGLASVAGVALGNLANVVAAALGLSSLLAASPVAFAVLRYAGAAYLVWLGLQLLRRPAAVQDPVAAPASRGKVLRQGILVSLLNPKTTLFFAAFLPPFMQAPAAPMAQALVLGTLFVLIAAVSDTAYVLLATVLAPGRLREGAVRGRRVVALVYIALGLVAAFGGGRAPRA
jgi:threonine/homoserine/homoserine lactone efflux protein